MSEASSGSIAVSEFGSLFCPTCGSSVFTADEGLNEELCAHVVFIVDWLGEMLTVQKAEDPDANVDIDTLWEVSKDIDDFLKSARKALPASVLIMQLAQTARGGGHDGSTFIAAFDFAS